MRLEEEKRRLEEEKRRLEEEKRRLEIINKNRWNSDSGDHERGRDGSDGKGNR